MDKSGQRQHPVVKSRLNWIRELFILLCSLVLWLYCLMVVVVLSSTILNADTYLTRLLRTMLNIEKGEILKMYFTFAGIACIVTVYLVIVYFVNQRKHKRNIRQHKRYFNALLIILSLSFMADHSAEAADKLPKDKNACLGLNYHRIREDNLLDKILTFLSSSKELKIYSITDTSLDKQLKWLTDHDATFVTIDELIKYKEKGKFPERCVWINFDDMDETIARNGQPILEKYNVPATGFVITGEVGNPNFHNLRILNKQELKELEDSNLWTFASHTYDLHTIVKNRSALLKTDNLRQDVKRSSDYLEQHFEGNLNTLAYPYGQIDKKVVNQLKDTQIKYGFTLEEDVIKPQSHDYYIPRIVVNDYSFEKLVMNWEAFK